MRLVSWNVNGLYNTLKDASVRYSSAFNYFSEVLKADIVCFQEAKIQEDKLEKWMACVSGYESFWAFSKEKKGYSGVVTYVKEEFSPLDAKADCLGDFADPSIEELCNEGRLMDTDHGSFVLINVYAPNAGERDQGRPRLGFKLKFLEALKRKCDQLVCSGRHFVVVGDFNVAHKDKDVHRTWNIRDIYSPEEIAFMDTFFTKYVDLFRYFHPDVEDVFSVWDQKKEARIHNEGVRIDYAVCDKGFLSQVICTDIVKMTPKGWSDHAAVMFTLKEQPTLAAHPKPAISSHNMKRFQEDHRQKKLTMLFSSTPSKGRLEAEPVEIRHDASRIGTSSSFQGATAAIEVHITSEIRQRCAAPSLNTGNISSLETGLISEVGDPKLMATHDPDINEVQSKASSGSLGQSQDGNTVLMPAHEEAGRKPNETFSTSRGGSLRRCHSEARKKEEDALVGQAVIRFKDEESMGALLPSKQSDGVLVKRQKANGSSTPFKRPASKTHKIDSGFESKQRSLTSYFHRDPD